ncbi:hypothetical protein Moror_14623 [Moniliophthora roreri MCA 2997]|uniref:Uncharacterized protein n=1 Tax=Moniliophthora roreri (strain MCA 2997) TaxID=1381753 RepID=V2XL60_MONRO|nr:hypothetical protein Moror_14623 [Moniliophthora roreri MCA 2997]
MVSLRTAQEDRTEEGGTSKVVATKSSWERLEDTISLLEFRMDIVLHGETEDAGDTSAIASFDYQQRGIIATYTIVSESRINDPIISELDDGWPYERCNMDISLFLKGSHPAASHVEASVPANVS